MSPRILGILFFFGVVLFLSGFQLPSLPGVPSEVGKGLGIATKAGSKAVVAAREITDSEEYYVGRAVAARILGKYPLYQNQAVTLYVNQVGQSVARKSSRPSTYRGYHFAVLDTSEPNAFACPGGIILITRGLLQQCQNEDELAAVLAHEVAHVANKDGINSISKARWTEVLTATGTEAARQFGGGVAANLVNLFEGAIDDVFKTIVVNGYSRTAEANADRGAVSILSRAGYNPAALVSLLSKMSAKGGSGGIFRTHPPTSERLAQVKSQVREAPASPAEQTRTKRFQQVKF
jgi:predicted Zn-dependent protease